MKARRNLDKDDLYCVECKSRIYIGDKYIEAEEEYFDEIIIKEYHPECIPEEDA